jgi:hypothetical protein
VLGEQRWQQESCRSSSTGSCYRAEAAQPRQRRELAAAAQGNGLCPHARAAAWVLQVRQPAPAQLPSVLSFGCASCSTALLREPVGAVCSRRVVEAGPTAASASLRSTAFSSQCCCCLARPVAGVRQGSISCHQPQYYSRRQQRAGSQYPCGTWRCQPCAVSCSGS